MRFNNITKLFALILMLSQTAIAQNARYASEQRASAAVTYYSRARTMLVEALAEYEQGRRYAQPNMIHDPEEFRLALISLTEELNRLVDPHVKITRDGVRVKANPRMIRRERDRLPQVVDGAQDANDYGEKRRMKELKEARARTYAPKEEAVKEQMEEQVKEEEPKKGDPSDADRKESVDKIIEQAVEQKALEQKSDEISSDSEADALVETAKEEVKIEQDSTGVKAAPTEEVLSENEQESGVSKKAETSEKLEEDAAVASAIESTIQERLKNLEVGLDEEVGE